ncbi:MAG: class I SAM-dependent methyltransferase [Sedimentisphaerales bacterium]|nr:class I SAM-dependent methyltransferase [Sedimentisphaerales bacterium]
MTIEELIKRATPPEPWSEGEKIPWNEPAFSERMLREHLSQEHDLASRRSSTIDAHADWIHNHVLNGRPSRILDLGCGPGLYAGRLAKMGHVCTGIDFSPASIRYAKEQAAEEELRCTYVHADVRKAEFGSGFDLAMFLYGELNVFRPGDARLILEKARAALKPGGMLLFEPHRFATVEKIGRQAPFWQSAEAGLFSDAPHLWLRESFWDAQSRTATTRYFIVDTATGAVSRMADTMQAYTDKDYHDLLQDVGFAEIETLPHFDASAGQEHSDLMLIRARRPSEA